MRRRHPDILERDDRVVVVERVGVRGGAYDAHAGSVDVDDEERLVAGVRAGGQDCLEERVGRMVERRHVPLHAVQNVVVAVAARSGLQVRHVGPGVLLGDRVALLHLAAHGREEPGRALVVVGHVGPPGRRSRQAPGQAVGDPAGLLLHQHLLEGCAALPADRGRHVGGIEAALDGRCVLRSAHVPGQLPVVLLGGLLERNQPVGELARSALEVEIRRGQAVHGTLRPAHVDWPFSLCEGRIHDQCIDPASVRRRCRRRWRHHRRLVRLVPQPGRSAGRRPRREGHPRVGRELTSRRDGAGAGRHRDRRTARSVQPGLLRQPARPPRRRLRLRRPGLLHAVLLGRGGRACARSDSHAAEPRARRALARSGGARRPQPGDGAGPDPGRVLRSRRRLHRPPAQRAGVRRCTLRGGGHCARAYVVRGVADLRWSRHGGDHLSRDDHDRAGRPDRWADAGRRRPGRRRSHPRRWRPAPGRGDPAAPRPAAGVAADGVRPGVRDLLAPA